MKHRDIKNILVLRNDRFGEFLLIIPTLRALKETFTNAKLIAVVNPYVKELAECVPFIDEIITWDRQRQALIEKLRLIKLLRGKNIDMALMLNPSKEFNISSWLAGIPIRAGYDRKWGFLLTHKIKDKKYLGQKHEIAYNLELAGIVGAKTEDKTLSLSIEKGIINTLPQAHLFENCANLVALNPWTSDPIKQWPISNFRELALKLIKKLDLKVVIIGSAEESSKSREFFDNHNNLFNLTGKTTLRQLAAVLSKCKLLISCDSGPVHLAGCVGIPVIAIFRNDLPGKTALRWGPVSDESVVIERRSLNDITVEEVFLKSEDILK